MEIGVEKDDTPNFTDLVKRNWRVALNFMSLEAVRDLGIDLGTPHTIAQNWAKLMLDDAVALRVIWCLVENQATSQQVDRDDWLKAMNGVSLERALAALEEAVLLFIRPQQRGIVTAGLEKLHEGHAESLAKAAAAVKALNAQTAEQALARLGISDPKSLESLAGSTIAGIAETLNGP